MNFLYPLFLAGAAVVALPILLHLIRRHTRRRVTFSSLMFLHTTAPRFRSRSRLEHVSLLLLRCLAVCLLAFAFARPFLLRPAATRPAEPGKRVVLLLDTSASMRRAGLWARALEEAKSVLTGTGATDRLCVMSFDRNVRILFGFEQGETMDPGQRTSIVTEELSRLSCGWAATDLGHALIAAAEALEDDEAADGGSSRRTAQIVLVSDLQQGSKLDALLAYEWPQQTELVVKAIPCPSPTNASLQWVARRDPLGPSRDDGPPAIRVTNSPDATNDRFGLQWADDPSSQATEVYVAPGHSTVVNAPERPRSPAAAKLILTGDDHDFDNTLYVAPELQRQVNILYLGSDEPNDTAGMLYYLRQAFGTGKALTSRVTRRPGDDALPAADIDSAHLIVVTEALHPRSIAPLRRHLERGRSLLLAMKSPETGAALSGLAGIASVEPREADVSRYAMLGRLEFEHPLLKPFSDPRYGDFTRIHFWKYRRIDVAACPGARVLAWFDSNEGSPAQQTGFGGPDPAWFEIPVGRGSLLVWTSGWQPADSDLALSSKFVPLLYSILEYGGTFAERQSQYVIGEAVPVPTRTSAEAVDLQIRKPDGSLARLPAGRPTFTETDLPGIYAIADFGSRIADSSRDTSSQSFAVNLPAAESRTEPMPVEELEKLGVALNPASGSAPEPVIRAAQSGNFADMESEQKLWRWVLAATLIMLLIEIWLGGRLARLSPAPEKEPI
jgi:hypothetical protein